MKMRRITKYALVLSALILAQSADAQNDKWWQKLFKKRPAQNQQDNQPKDTEPDVTITPEAIDSTDTLPTIDEPDTDTIHTVPSTPGEIRYDLDPGIARLDQEFKENPPDVRGYRVQIFFGDLTPAREKRARFISSHPGTRCYLHQAAPNFGVRVGNFRDMEAAYRMLLELKSSYPNALIVPDKIEV